MMKSKVLVMLALVLLSGCVTARPVAVNRDQAKAAASFCAVAEYQPILPDDPVETQAAKASNNAKGAYLHCAWAHP
jgi:uncharacterized protein YcfL